jgi:hypothetical protein
MPPWVHHRPATRQQDREVSPGHGDDVVGEFTSQIPPPGTQQDPPQSQSTAHLDGRSLEPICAHHAGPEGEEHGTCPPGQEPLQRRRERGSKGCGLQREPRHRDPRRPVRPGAGEPIWKEPDHASLGEPPVQQRAAAGREADLPPESLHGTTALEVDETIHDGVGHATQHPRRSSQIGHPRVAGHGLDAAERCWLQQDRHQAGAQALLGHPSPRRHQRRQHHGVLRFIPQAFEDGSHGRLQEASNHARETVHRVPELGIGKRSVVGLPRLAQFGIQPGVANQIQEGLGGHHDHAMSPLQEMPSQPHMGQNVAEGPEGEHQNAHDRAGSLVSAGGSWCWRRGG